MNRGAQQRISLTLVHILRETRDPYTPISLYDIAAQHIGVSSLIDVLENVVGDGEFVTTDEDEEIELDKLWYVMEYE